MANFLLLSQENKVNEFEASLLQTNRNYDVLVDWEGIITIVDLIDDEYSLELNAMNCLINVKNDEKFKKKFFQLVKNNKRCIELFPYLIALSKKDKYNIKNGNEYIIAKKLDKNIYKKFHFCGDNLKSNEINKYYVFFKDSGLKELFQNMVHKDVRDYIIGTLVGLDSNGRKNRSGKVFEKLCSPIISKAVKKNNLEFYEQIKAKYAKDNLSMKIPKSYLNTKFDFLITNKRHTKFLNIEVNFYSGEGSKPREIIHSYADRKNKLKKVKIEFCQITDGPCWIDNHEIVTMAFNEVKYLMNYTIAKNGAIDKLLKRYFK